LAEYPEVKAQRERLDAALKEASAKLERTAKPDDHRLEMILLQTKQCRS
jgi:hypothetical protein